MTVSPQSQHELTDMKAELLALGRGLDKVSERLGRLSTDPVPDNGTPPLVVFVHIPKTAGGTLTSMFTRAWEKRSVHKAGNFMKGPDKTVRKVTKRSGAWENWSRRGGRLSVGHVPYEVLRQRLPEDSRFITFLRDPVDRVLSHYYRHIHVSEPDPYAEFWNPDGTRAGASSLEEAILERRLPQVNNLATRFLCDDPRVNEHGEEALERAKINLNRFAFVGIQERFEESVALLQLTLGLDPVPYGLDRHVSTDRPTVDEISDEQRDLVREHNRLDAALYDHGRELFDGMLADAASVFTARLEELRAARAVAYEQDTAELHAACEWLERELPLGSTKPRAAVVAAARDSEIKGAHIKRAMRELPGLEKWGGDAGEVRLTRIGEPGSESAIRFEQLKRTHEEGLAQAARDWLAREFPPGAARSRDWLLTNAQSAGISTLWLKRVVQETREYEVQATPTGEAELIRTAGAKAR